MTFCYRDESTYDGDPLDQVLKLNYCIFENGTELALVYNNGGEYSYEEDEEYDSDKDNRIYINGNTIYYLGDYDYYVLLECGEHVSIFSIENFDKKLSYVEKFEKLLQLFQDLYKTLSLD